MPGSCTRCFWQIRAKKVFHWHSNNLSFGVAGIPDGVSDDGETSAATALQWRGEAETTELYVRGKIDVAILEPD